MAADRADEMMDAVASSSAIIGLFSGLDSLSLAQPSSERYLLHVTSMLFTTNRPQDDVRVTLVLLRSGRSSVPPFVRHNLVGYQNGQS